MRAKWLLETTVFEQNADNKMIELLDKKGMECKLAHGAHEIWGVKTYLDLFGPQDCVVVRGSIEFCGEVRRESPWVPGVYMTMDNYDCTNYYPIFGDRLLNQDYTMIPYGDLRRKKYWLFETLGEQDALFIRPNRGAKIFKGQVIYKERFEKDLKQLGFYDVPDRELCVVARPQNLVSEVRCVVVDGKVITGSKYIENGKLVPNAEPIDFTWLCLAQSCVDYAPTYRPDRAWCLDLCQTKDGRIRILEVGAFSCAGLYGCDVDTIIDAVSLTAEQEWEEYYGHDSSQNEAPTPE